jgi:hypothetical protein
MVACTVVAVVAKVRLIANVVVIANRLIASSLQYVLLGKIPPVIAVANMDDNYRGASQIAPLADQRVKIVMISSRSSAMSSKGYIKIRVGDMSSRHLASVIRVKRVGGVFALGS